MKLVILLYISVAFQIPIKQRHASIKANDSIPVAHMIRAFRRVFKVEVGRA